MKPPSCGGVQDLLGRLQRIMAPKLGKKARQEARWLLNYVCEKGDHGFFLETSLTEAMVQKAVSMAQTRATGLPFAYVVGEKPFWKDTFFVNTATLIPRPESEGLVEGFIKLFPHKNTPYRILDLGTGSGCLLLSLLREYPESHGVGVDISWKALEVAAKNARHLGLEKRCLWVQSSWTQALKKNVCEAGFDMIVSNPPYVDPEHEHTLAKDAALYEPASALFAPHKGLGFYPDIFQGCQNLLGPKGVLALEGGGDQAIQIQSLAHHYGYQRISYQRDLAGYLRCGFFKSPPL